MPKRIEIVLPPEEAANETSLKRTAAKQCGIPETDITGLHIHKRSIDARSKNPVYRLQVDVFTEGESTQSESFTRNFHHVSSTTPVIIIGAGPAGLFAALKLLELGLKPVIIERGKGVRDRRRDLALLNKLREVNPDSNYCFGEGGAGTYSDGKLYTRSDKRGDVSRVLQTFMHFGAHPDIAVDAHPHIGTNKLPGIISAISACITSHGGEIHFNTRFEALSVSNGRLNGIKCTKTDSSGHEFRIEGNAVILATGHSARDIFEYLHREKIAITAKPFALGVRIEHPQELIDRIQYHCTIRNPHLPPAPYSLSMQSGGRGVYSFCMCPGGIIAAAATSPGEVVVNGWSPSKRNNEFANSGMVVSVDDNDFRAYEKYGELRAMKYQEAVEHNAFSAGGSSLAAPAQRLTDFISGKLSTDLPSCSYIPGIVPAALHEILPAPVHAALREGMEQFGKKMKGYMTHEAVLVATESRTSSPVRIPRDNITLMHPQVVGLFPCGEGAGYAGGIMSAAIDGEKSAQGVAEFLNHMK